MAITTRISHVRRAQEFFEKTDFYFCIARRTEWTDEQSPPMEDEHGNITEPIGYRKIDHIYFVVPDNENGTIVYRNQKYKIVTASNAEAEGAKWIYLETTILYDELPVGLYRQIGLYQGLTKKAEVPSGKFAITPDEVDQLGDLLSYSNRQPSNRQADQKEKLSIILEF